MGRGSSKANGGGAVQIPATTPGANPVTNAVAFTDADANALRQLEDSTYDANTTAAIKMYISDTNFDGQGHSLSQTMNYLLDNGVDLDAMDNKAVNQQFGLSLSANDMASMQYTNSRMNAAYHTLGKDTMLQRGAHDDMLRQTFGIADYSTMTEAQLKSALVGQKFQNTSPMSTSYDISKNPFLGSSSGVSGGREVVYNIKAGGQTKVLLGAKKQSEIICATGTNWKITDVHYTGKTATPRGKGYKPQIQIDIETF